MRSRQARERQETADDGQGSKPPGAHPDPLQEEEELEVGRRSSRTEGLIETTTRPIRASTTSPHLWRSRIERSGSTSSTTTTNTTFWCFCRSSTTPLLITLSLW